MISNIFFSENRAVYEIIWKNIIQPDRPQITIYRTRFACWIPKAINTLSEYVIITDFPLHERSSLLRYTYFAFLFLHSATISRHELNTYMK